MFLFFDGALLNFLGLQKSSLLISGGIILFLVSLGMIFPSKPVFDGEANEEPFIVPLAIPLLAGPSTLILLILLSQQHADAIMEVAIATFLTWALSAVILFFYPLHSLFVFSKKRDHRARAFNGHATHHDFCVNVHGWNDRIPARLLTRPAPPQISHDTQCVPRLASLRKNLVLCVDSQITTSSGK